MAQLSKQSYDPARHSALPYVDKRYKILLDQVADQHHWTKKTTVEIAIEQLAARNGVETVKL